jgi:hypothetical protein
MSAFLPIFIGGAIAKYSSKPIAIFIGAITQASLYLRIFSNEDELFDDDGHERCHRHAVPDLHIQQLYLCRTGECSGKSWKKQPQRGSMPKQKAEPPQNCMLMIVKSAADAVGSTFFQKDRAFLTDGPG